MTTTAPATTSAPKRRTGRALFAGAAAIALLSAGGGSFALWQDSADVETATTITSGTLDIEAGDEGTWTYAGTTDTPKLIVPGDTLTYSQKVKVTAHGENLTATLSADLAELGIPGVGGTDLASILQPTLTVNNGVETTFPMEIKPRDGVQELNVKVTITFPKSGDAMYDMLGQNQTVTLNDVPITLTQTKA